MSAAEAMQMRSQSISSLVSEKKGNTSKMKSQSGEVEMGTGGSSGSTTSSGARWNPTKEQIGILENLYKQGMRTPNADQIQHITNKLRVYGHIEGKNVFYWFQNHKARQRQKQKQESIAYVNRFIQYPSSQPIFPSPFYQHDVYWLQQNGISFYPQQQPKMFVAGGISPRTEKVASLGMPRIYDGPHRIYEYLQQGKPNYNLSNTSQETLTLFPLHPTGIKEGKTRDKLHSLDSISVGSSVYTSNSGSPRVDEDGSSIEKKQFFEFFTSVQGSRGRE